MAAAAVARPTDALHAEPTTLFYYLEVRDGGIVQTFPGTAFEKRRKHVPHPVNITDLRPIRSEFSLDKNAFELVDFAPREKEFLDEEQVQNDFYPECIDLIKKKTGATTVKVISHMCRRHTFKDAVDTASGKGDDEFVTKNNPARFVHVDQSYRGAEQILYLNLDKEEADRLTKTRWGIMNVWAPIKSTVKRDPLAFCDFQTLDENDLRTVVANLPPPGAGQYGNVSKNVGGDGVPRYEVANLAHNPDQHWYYASEVTPEEAWLFKIFDSKKDGTARCAVHSSFPLKNQDEVSATPRESIEVRCFVFWEDQDLE